MKHIKILFLLFVLVITTTGCKQEIVLHQPKSEIVQIDLVYSPFGEHKTLLTLAEEDYSVFLDGLMELKLHKHTSPSNIGGALYVRILYADESEEILGTWSVGYISNGILEHDGWYYIPNDDLHALFSKFTDIPSSLK